MHANARLNGWGRRLIVERHMSGIPLSYVADQLGVSRQTASKWWQRFLADPDGVWWADRSSRPQSCPHQILTGVEERIVALRSDNKWGPWRIGRTVGVSSATVRRVLKDQGMNRLRFLAPPTGQIIRYERDRPGELVHIDTKKFGRIPDGGGRFTLGEAGYRTGERIRAKVGYIHVHAAIDDHSRVAYVGVFNDATAVSCAQFLTDTINYFAAHGIRIDTIMTDNARAYTGKLFTSTRTDNNIDHILTRPYQPQTNDKVERFHRTLKTEWSHANPYTNETQRTPALDTWLNYYNTARHHTATEGPPLQRVNNQPD